MNFCVQWIKTSILHNSQDLSYAWEGTYSLPLQDFLLPSCLFIARTCLSLRS